MEKKELSPHILIFPCPLQGHVNPMLKFSQLLDLSGDVHVTFLVTTGVHARLRAHTDVGYGRFSNRFRLQEFPAGIYEGHVDTLEGYKDMFDSLHRIGKPFLREYIAQNQDSKRPFTCFISDFPLTLTLDICEDFDLPVYYFRTISACCFWIYISVADLVEGGLSLPIKENEMDSFVTKVKGMEDFLRVRDLPSFARTNYLTNLFYIESQLAPRARAFILNTFEELEGPILSQIRTKCPKVYTIGPLHAHLEARIESKTTSSNGFWKEDKICMDWLDAQEPKSIVYVSFGSIATITRHKLMEFWHGLVNSGHKFLWVMRNDLVAENDGEDLVPLELKEGPQTNGYIVSWAPQEQVLGHPAIGGFITHSGWNSTLESIVAGVPMICWPLFADQPINSRFVSHVWRLGLDMKDVCDRITIENMIRELMDNRKNEFLDNAENMAKLAKQAISEDGSSYCNFNSLIQDMFNK